MSVLHVSQRVGWDSEAPGGVKDHLTWMGKWLSW